MNRDKNKDKDKDKVKDKYACGHVDIVKRSEYGEKKLAPNYKM